MRIITIVLTSEQVQIQTKNIKIKLSEQREPGHDPYIINDPRFKLNSLWAFQIIKFV